MWYLNIPEPFQFEGGAQPPAADGYELRLENVSFHYPGTGRDILRHIDLTIHPGEKLAVVGLNGAGKPTMVMLLCGFYDPTEGRVLLNGQDIREFGNVKKCAVGKHPKSEKHGNTAQFSEVERSGTQENCGGIESGCRLRLRPLPVLHRRQSQRVARIDPNAVVVDKNIAENDRFDLFSR